jgi:succinate dehydrogenase / fumarate reductase flavoprotein subunit
MASKASILSERGKLRRVIVVGGGLAGLMTVIKLCEANVPVLLLSLVPVKRSHSVCAQGGINASIDTKGEGDSPRIHMEESVYGGDFLANQPPVKGMAEAAPDLIRLLDRMGVPFNRTPEGLLDFRRFGGSLFHRTAFAGATTGQQLLYALDEQVRRWETVDVVDAQGQSIAGETMVRKLEYWDVLAIVRDDHGVAIGVVAQNLHNMKIEAFAGDAACLATGGCGAVFGRSTNSLICTGTAAAIAYQQGAVYANGEFIQVHPTAIPGADKLRLISESARGEGGRIWVPKDPRDVRSPRDIPESGRDYFLERMYPGYGNLVPRDIASRALFQVGFHEQRGVFNPRTGRNEREVYLDLTHLNPALLRRKLAGILEIYEKFAGEDPYAQPMRVFPAVHYTMGGLWVDYEARADGNLVVGSPRNQATSIPGLYAVGEVDYQYHGANRLGANSLLSCLYAGLIAGPAIAAYRDALARSAFDLPGSLFDRARALQSDRYDEITSRAQTETHPENPFRIHAELGELMLRDCTIERHNEELRRLLSKLDELGERMGRVRVPDRVARMNQSAQFVRHLENMLVLARVIALGALNREECRGAHYKPACDPDHSPGAVGRDDQHWLRTTLAVHRGPGQVEFVRQFDYECAGQPVRVTDQVDVSLVPPRPRRYEQAGATHQGQQKPTGTPGGERSARLEER